MTFGEWCGFSYAFIVVDETESLMSQFDEGTMSKKEIGIRFLQRYHELLKEYSINGRLCYQRTLILDSAYGSMRCVINIYNETKRAMNIIHGPAKLESGLLNDIDEFNKTDPNFRLRIGSQTRASDEQQ